MRLPRDGLVARLAGVRLAANVQSSTTPGEGGGSDEEHSDDAEAAARALAERLSLGGGSMPAPPTAPPSAPAIDEESWQGLRAKLTGLLHHLSSPTLSCLASREWMAAAADVCQLSVACLSGWHRLVATADTPLLAAHSAQLVYPCLAANDGDGADGSAGDAGNTHSALQLASSWQRLLTVIRDRCLVAPSDVPMLLPTVSAFLRPPCGPKRRPRRRGRASAGRTPVPAYARLPGSVPKSSPLARAVACAADFAATPLVDTSAARRRGAGSAASSAGDGDGHAGMLHEASVATAVNRTVFGCVADLAADSGVVACNAARVHVWTCLHNIMESHVAPWLGAVASDADTADMTDAVVASRYAAYVDDSCGPKLTALGLTSVCVCVRYACSRVDSDFDVGCQLVEAYVAMEHPPNPRGDVSSEAVAGLLIDNGVVSTCVHVATTTPSKHLRARALSTLTFLLLRSDCTAPVVLTPPPTPAHSDTPTLSDAVLSAECSLEVCARVCWLCCWRSLDSLPHAGCLW